MTTVKTIHSDNKRLDRETLPLTFWYNTDDKTKNKCDKSPRELAEELIARLKSPELNTSHTRPTIVIHTPGTLCHNFKDHSSLFRDRMWPLAQQFYDQGFVVASSNGLGARGGDLGTLDPETGQLNNKWFPSLSTVTLGKGFRNHQRYWLNVLNEMKKLGHDPNEFNIVAIGYSRGACQSIALANEIYEHYPNANVDLYLQDPVMGFMSKGAHEPEKHTVIPPNVGSMITVYSQNEPTPGFEPHDWSRLIPSSNRTAITTFALPLTHLDSCWLDNKPQTVNDWMQQLKQNIVNAYRGGSQISFTGTAHLDSTKQVGQTGPRKNCRFVYQSGLDHSPDYARDLHSSMRQTLWQKNKQPVESKVLQPLEQTPISTFYQQKRRYATTAETAALALSVLTFGFSANVFVLYRLNAELNRQKSVYNCNMRFYKDKSIKLAASFALNILTLNILPVYQLIKNKRDLQNRPDNYESLNTMGPDYKAYY